MNILGVDLGWTVVNNRTKEPYPDAFRVLKRFALEWDNVYIISKVNEEQKLRSLVWLRDWDFHRNTRIPKENLFYCAERQDKGVIADTLSLTHFIDDRAEVLAFMAPDIEKFLFNPRPNDVVEHFNFLHNTKIVKDWKEIELEWLG